MEDGELSLDRPPYLTQTITQALALPDPPQPEPRQHASVNALFDFRAEHSPDRRAVGFTTLNSSSSHWTCTTLTYAQVKRLSIRLAYQLRKSLGEPARNVKSPNKTPVVAVLSPSGIHLFAHILALWRLGYGVLCIAPGSPSDSIANLLRTTATKTILCHQSQLEAAKSGVKAAASGNDGLESRTVSMTDDITQFQDDKHNGEAPASDLLHCADAEDVLVVMHTSGSSGLPKPIYQLHRFWSASMVSAPGVALSAFTTTPLFHGGMSDMLRSVQAGSTIFFHPTADPGALSSSAICAAIQACPALPVSYFLSVPYILDLLYSDEPGKQMLKSMQLVSTGGAPLPQHLGDAMVSDKIRLVSRLGSSECGFLMSSWRDFESDKEWSHLRVPDEQGRKLLRFEEATPPSETSAGTFELVVAAGWPVKLMSNRDDGSYATSDLYAPHATKPHTWRYDSRSDDTLVLINGKKVPALLAETKLKMRSEVSEAIVFGANRAILGALVYVTPEAFSAQGGTWNTRTKIEILQALRPTLETINEQSPPHAQLAIEMMHLMTPDEAKQIPRASKGSLQRGRAYTQYASLIDQVYADFEEGRSLRLSDDADNPAGKQKLSGSELLQWITETVKRITGVEKLDPEADFFVAGVDSIQAARIRAAMHQNIDLGRDGTLLAKNVVYDYPTPTLLVQHIDRVRQKPDADTSVNDRNEQDLDLMQQYVETYARVGKTRPVQQDTATKVGLGTLYLLTGSTGGLGAQITSELLLKLTDADRLILLLRAESDAHALKRVSESLSAKKLIEAQKMLMSAVNNSSDVFCIASDPSKVDCGLSNSMLEKLAFMASNAERVVTIHAAWAVNFVIGLTSFEHSQIRGLQNLISLHESLTSSSVAGKSFFGFCSSTASILGEAALESKSGEQVYTETLPSDPRAAVAMGYARSKWVAENILARVAKNSSVRSRYAVLRIGQLCSDTQHGVWNESEAWPILISLSCKLGRFPRLGSGVKLDWLPVDVAARTILNLVHASEAVLTVYNIAMPSSSSRTERASWDQLYSWLTSSGLKLQQIPPMEWIQLVKEKELDDRGLLPLWERNFSSPPAADTFYETAKTDVASPENFQPWKQQGVDETLIHKSVQRWKETGFLQ